MAPDNPQVFTPYLPSRSPAASSLVQASALQQPSTLHAYSADMFRGPGGQLPARASNAADATIPVGVVVQDAVFSVARFIPQSSQAGSATHFANISLIDMGTDGLGTTVLGSYTLSAAGQGVPAGSSVNLLTATVSVAAGHMLGVKYASQGSGIAIVAHAVETNYRLA